MLASMHLVEGRGVMKRELLKWKRFRQTVLLSPGIELIFLLSIYNSAVFWIQYRNWYEKNADNILIFSVTSRK